MRRCQSVTASCASPTASSVASSKGRPASWQPTGMPPAKPQGPRGNVLVQLRPKGDRRLEGVLESPSNGQGAEVRVGEDVVVKVRDVEGGRR